MKIKKDGKVVTLTESDLRRIVKRVLNEQTNSVVDELKKQIGELKTIMGQVEDATNVSSQKDLVVKANTTLNNINKLYTDNKTEVDSQDSSIGSQIQTLNKTNTTNDKPNEEKSLNKVLTVNKTNTTHDKSYDYKLVDGKVYFKGKGDKASKYPNWVEATGKGLESIKKNVKF